MKEKKSNFTGQVSLQETFADLLNQIEARDKKNGWLQEELLHIQKKSAQKIDEAIQARDEAIHSQEMIIQSRDEAIQARDEAIQSRDMIIQARDEAIQSRDMIIQARDEAIQSRDMIIQARDEAILWLQNELFLKEQEHLKVFSSKGWNLVLFYRKIRSWLAQITFPIRHPIYWASEKLRNPKLRSFIKKILPSTFVNFLGNVIKQRNSPPVFISPALTTQQITQTLNKVRKPDIFDELEIYPQLVKNGVLSNLSNTPSVYRTLPDIICFSIIDWDFRYQRPQQIMSQFAEHGHRVFYVSVSKFLSNNSTPRFASKEIKKNIFEISLAVDTPPSIYGHVICGNTLKSMLLSLSDLRNQYQIEESISYVMIASWTDLAIESQKSWGWHVIYDCMDEWDTFPLIEQAIVTAENRLVNECNLLVVTAQRLFEKWKDKNKSIVLARNAVDYDFYMERLQANELLGDVSYPIVGYYGAIADWFDLELMLFIAKKRPHYTFVLIGGIFDVDVSQLKALPNVKLLGQQPYELMPKYLYSFDACIIPFKINAVTEATDPVKVYEYLCAGKPVVSVALPELSLFEELLYIARTGDEFINKLDLALKENDADIKHRRIEFAKQNTWTNRYQTIYNRFIKTVPICSIVVVTYNNLSVTKLCLESIFRNTEYPNLEIIVVDNKSTDNTQEFLRTLSKKYNNVHLILNDENQGFAKANNQGLEQAKGEFLVLLNNDTIVPPGWLSRLLRHLRDPEIGIVGPVTNFVGNEAKVEVNYHSWGEMEEFAKHFTWEHDSKIADIQMLAMFCVAFRRDTYLIVGPLDEQFGIGMFEDDDYSMRMRTMGNKVVCAFDAFVHHFGQAAFKKLIDDGSYNSLFSENQAKYEKKWKTKWVAHKNAMLFPYPHHSSDYSMPINHQDSSVAKNAQDDYESKLKHENQKWGEHLKIEASGEWNAWLDHPVIVQHYYDLSLIDNLRWEKWVTKHLDGPARKSLDLGCGAGARSMVVWDAGSTEFVEGMDISEDRIQEAERIRQSKNIPGHFYVADVNKISLQEDVYDLIFSAHSFHHFIELEHVMEQVSRSLTKRGLFILEEFVGPTQFQWTDLQIQYTQELLSKIPNRFRFFRDGRLKVAEGRPTVEQVVAVSPFESIRSADILPLFQKYFDIIEIRNLGGTIQHLLYNGIMHNFKIEDEDARKHILEIIKYEDQLIKDGNLPGDFMLLVGKKRKQ